MQTNKALRIRNSHRDPLPSIQISNIFTQNNDISLLIPQRVLLSCLWINCSKSDELRMRPEHAFCVFVLFPAISFVSNNGTWRTWAWNNLTRLYSIPSFIFYFFVIHFLSFLVYSGIVLGVYYNKWRRWVLEVFSLLFCSCVPCKVIYALRDDDTIVCEISCETGSIFLSFFLLFSR